jgi:thioredoxin-like negative regulator of GroEL
MTPLTDTSFSQFVRGHRFALVHFWAVWNAYDLRMRALLESQIPSDLSDRVAFGTLDIDPAEHVELCKQHGVRNVPFLAFYRDGSLVRTLTGLRVPEVIVQHLRELVDQPEPAGESSSR